MKNHTKIYNRLILLSLFLSLVFILGVTLHPLKENGLWSDLTVGREIVKNFKICQTDVFSYASENASYLHENWLYQVLVFLLFRIIGISGLIVLKSLILCCVAFLFMRLSYRRAWNPGIAAIVLAATFYLFRDHWLLRAQTFGFVLFLILIYCMLQFHLSKKKIYLFCFPAIMLVWVNIHPSFIIGIILLVTFLIVELVKKYIRHRMSYWVGPSLRWKILIKLTFSVIASVAVLFINPYGKDIIPYSLHTIGNSTLFCVKDWFVFERVLMFNVYLLIIPAFTFLSMFFVPVRKSDLTHGILMTVAFVFGYLVKRYTIFPFLIAVVFGIKYLSHMLKVIINELGMNKRLQTIVSIGFALLCIGSIVGFGKMYIDQPDTAFFTWQPCPPDICPTDVVEFIKDNPVKPNIYTPISYAGFFLYHLYPEYKCFADLRELNIYEPIVYESTRLEQAQIGWEWITKKYDINTIVLPAIMGKRYILDYRDLFHDKLAQSPDWRLIYWDDNNIVYQRTPYSIKSYDPQKLYISLDPEDMQIFFNADAFTINAIKKELLRRKKQDPPSAWCYVFLGIIYAREGDFKIAKEYFDIAGGMLDQKKVVLFSDVLEWHLKGAHKPLETSVTGYSLTVEDKLQAAYNLMTMNLFNDAKRILETVIAGNSDNIEAFIMMGICKDKLGDYINALVAFQRALILSPNNPMIYWYMAKCYLNNGIWDQAGEKLRDSLAYDEKNYRLWYQLGRIYYKLGNYNRAISMIKRAVRFRPHHFDSWFLAGNIYRRKGNLRESMEVLNKALILRPFYEKVYMEVAETYLEAKKVEKARAIIERIDKENAEFFQQDPQYLYVKARISAHDNDADAVYGYIKTIKELDDKEYLYLIKHKQEFKPFLSQKRFKKLLK